MEKSDKSNIKVPDRVDTIPRMEEVKKPFVKDDLEKVTSINSEIEIDGSGVKHSSVNLDRLKFLTIKYKFLTEKYKDDDDKEGFKKWNIDELEELDLWYKENHLNEWEQWEEDAYKSVNVQKKILDHQISSVTPNQNKTSPIVGVSIGGMIKEGQKRKGDFKSSESVDLKRMASLQQSGKVEKQTKNTSKLWLTLMAMGIVGVLLPTFLIMIRNKNRR